ncbi:MAG: hypothetical protein K2O24_01405 [Muribaculaceae bacterium]|nr:hypothetical protein [Muribaculaceae bacterium]
MKRKYTLIQTATFMLLLLAAVLTGCRDDLDYLRGGISDETTSVRLCVDFAPASEALTRSTFNGDAVKDIEDLWLVIFDKGGNFHSMQEIDIATKCRVEDIDRVPADASNGVLAGEVTTKRLSCDLDLPLGTYYVYALSNMRRYDAQGNLIETTGDYLRSLFPAGASDTPSRREFCEMKREWSDGNIAANSELTGYVVNADENGKSESPQSVSPDKEGNLKINGDGNTVTVTKGLNILHCWLRRMVSKVTVTFDASELSDNISVYIHDVRIHDLAKEAPILAGGAVTSEEGLIQTSQVLAFCGDNDIDRPVSEWATYRENWPELSKSNFSFDRKDSFDDCLRFPHLSSLTHSNSAKALFFYENLQGEGESKLQDATDENGNNIPDGIVDSPLSGTPGNDHFKDNKPLGTYVEVRGYYVNRIQGEASEGPIIYRFMLGRDITHNYDAERNFHYKLTLCLRGRANEVDWHIEYKAMDDDVYIPNPYYISYGYNESLSLPIKAKGKVTKVKATIVQNNWYPSQMWQDVNAPAWESVIADIPDQYKGNIQGTTNPAVPKITALGFLTLYQPIGDAIGTFVSPGTDENSQNPYLLSYWTGDKTHAKDARDVALYTRTYNLGNVNSAVMNEGDHGSWSYTRDNISGQDYTHLILPLYTRERNLAKTTAYTGQNPFTAYQRRAKVLYEIYMEGRKEPVKREINIVQVVRAGNPTGVWRAWNNSRPFHVALNLIDGDDNDTFHVLESRGGWSAEVILGADWVLLNGGRQKIYGSRGSRIEFDYRPAGVLSSPSASRFGIIEIKYHDYSCSHKILVRQGYVPIQLNNGDPYWHTYNMETATRETVTPMDEGSMFRYGKWEYPIASSNNYNDKNPWINVVPTDFKDASNTDFAIAGSDVTKKWGDIGSLSANDPFMDSNRITLDDGTVARMMEVADVKKLRDNVNNSFSYGILYGDEATTTLQNINEVYGYKGFLSHQQYGMRGCFVYNHDTGAQIFFPIGASGYGRRQNTGLHDLSKRHALLKYAGAGRFYNRSAATVYVYMKLFYTLFRGQGAIYWFYNRTSDPYAPDREDTDKDAAGLDINYFTLDFNPIQCSNINKASINSSDACLIRLVQDTPPN